MKRMLADVRPELINEWSQRNLPLTPDSVTHGSNKIVWWNGKCGYEWRASIKNRVISGSGCPYCSHNAILEGYNDLASQKPELAAEWSYKNAPLLPTQVQSLQTARLGGNAESAVMNGKRSFPHGRTAVNVRIVVD